jgi:hypothetical protein
LFYVQANEVEALKATIEAIGVLYAEDKLMIGFDIGKLIDVIDESKRFNNLINSPLAFIKALEAAKQNMEARSVKAKD